MNAVKKEDFAVDQTVWVLQGANQIRDRREEVRFHECEVVSVQRKYITVKKKEGQYPWELRFDMTDGFTGAEDNLFAEELFLFQKDAEDYLAKMDKVKEIRRLYPSMSYRLPDFSDDDVKSILDIFEKYRD